MTSFILTMGGLPQCVHLPAADWLPGLLERYTDFVTEEQLTVAALPPWEVTVVEEASAEDIWARWIVHEGPVTHFQVAGFGGWIDLSSRTARIGVPSRERAASAVDRITAYVLMQALPREREALLLHATGISIEGKGHCFFGASGAGKTTVARLAAGRGELLTDENVILQLAPDGPRLVSTPYWGHSTPPEMIRRKSRSVPLTALYELTHTPGFVLMRLGPGAAAAALLGTEKVATERVESADAWLAVAGRLVASVPVYRLGFRPTAELWDFLRESAEVR
jgi:hypothetical protein